MMTVNFCGVECICSSESARALAMLTTCGEQDIGPAAEWKDLPKIARSAHDDYLCALADLQN